MVRRDGIEFGARRETPLGELRRHPTAADHDPTPGLFALRRRGDLPQAVGKRAVKLPVKLRIPTQPRHRRVDMRIDQTWDHRPSAKIDDSGVRADVVADLAVAADGDETAIPDRDRFFDRESAIDGDDLAAAQDHVGGSPDRQRTGNSQVLSP